jgi:hypothetical protein
VWYAQRDSETLFSVLSVPRCITRIRLQLKVSAHHVTLCQGLRNLQSALWGTINRTQYNIFTCISGDYRPDMDWRLDLLTIYTHHSELQVFTALSLIYTLYHSLHAVFSSLQCFNSRFWQRLLTVEIHQLHELKLYLHSLPCRTQISTDRVKVKVKVTLRLAV